MIKQFFVTVSIIVVVLIIAIMAYNALRIIGLGVASSQNAPKMTKEELTICLNQNRDKYNNAADIFMKHPEILEIAGHDKFGKESKGRFYYTTKNKLYVESKEKLNDDIIIELENSSIKSIFEKLKFESILQMEDCVYFIEGSNLGYANGILYSPKKEKPEYEYLINLEKIEDKWFYFRFR